MKNTLLLLALAGSLTLPAVTYADQPVKGKRTTDKSKQVASAPSAPVKPHSPDFVITKQAITGSHIPIVAYRDGTRLVSASSEQIYGANELNRSGQLDVAGELYMLDPSITLSRGR